MTKTVLTDYKSYLKLSKSLKTYKSFLIDNDEFVDNTDIIDEYKKSTPLFNIHDKKRVHKYNITFSFFDIDKRHHIDIENKISSLNNKEYDISTTKDSITLFGKVENKGYVKINHNINHFNEIIEKVTGYLFAIFTFIAIVAGVVIYFIFSIKRLKHDTYHKEVEFDKLREDTQKLAFEDTLTGAATRLKFDETLKDLIQIASKFEKQKFTFLILDIDNFKRINDNFGHDYGDVVLKEVSSTIKSHIRGSDTFARWGGEEFVVLSPLTTLDESLMFADRLRKLIASIEFDKVEMVTCSFGLVEYKMGDDTSTIVKRADELLYKAKQNGKNRVEY
jgi:diguanylate cyclase (GGDEF)-like protein